MKFTKGGIVEGKSLDDYIPALLTPDEAMFYDRELEQMEAKREAKK